MMSYRLTINPALEMGDNTISFTFSTKDMLKHHASNMADLLLFVQDELKAMPDYSNMFIYEKRVKGGEWEELEEEDNE